MVCPSCGCRETYLYDEETDSECTNVGGGCYDGIYRCAACSSVFSIDDWSPEDDE